MMKKLILTVLMALVVLVCVSGQYQILYRDDFTILYDPPAELPELLSGESLVYRIWLWDMATGIPATTTTTGWLFYAETAALQQYVITPPAPRREWTVGVQLVHVRADLTEAVSDFAVTTVVEDVDPAGYPGVPFVYAPDTTSRPDKARNLRDSGM